MKHDTSSAIRVRFAPSPTGHLHIGGVRTAFFNWLFAQNKGGTFLFRIEDTDLERSRPEFTASILDAFAWLDIRSPEPMVIQSARADEHRRVAESMVVAGTAYRCFCTKEELRARLGANASEEEGYGKYDRRCRERAISTADVQQPHVIRFKIPAHTEQVVFQDLIHGPIAFCIEQFDDFIIVRSDGSPTYNFVVVVDDAFMGITQVIRGDDHIANTPKQILLYQAIGYKMPEFGHLPMILGPDGSRLSKRHAATAVLDYRQRGFLADALLNYLVRLGWSHGNQEIFTRDELIKYFSLKNVGAHNAIFDQAKLLWVNASFMRQLDAEKLLALLLRDVRPDFLASVVGWQSEQVIALVRLYKERVATLVELADILLGVYKAPQQPLPAEFSWTVETKMYIGRLHEVLLSANFERDQLEHTIKGLCKEWGISLGVVAQPLRVALTGSLASPGVFDLLIALGKTASEERIRTFLERLK
jgi:glutamyl-tRNA synthetase